MLGAIAPAGASSAEIAEALYGLVTAVLVLGCMGAALITVLCAGRRQWPLNRQLGREA